MPGRRRSVQRPVGPVTPQVTPMDSIRDALMIDVVAGVGSLVVSEIIGMWAMSKVDWPHMAEVFTAILIASLVSYVVARLMTHVQQRRQPRYASDQWGGGATSRRRRPGPMDTRDDYLFHDDGWENQ